MPGMDGKGPRGTGPLGRGLGNCRQNNATTATGTEQGPQPADNGQTMRNGRGNRGGGGAGRGGGGRDQR